MLRKISSIAFLLASAALPSCGGGGGEGSPPPAPPPALTPAPTPPPAPTPAPTPPPTMPPLSQPPIDISGETHTVGVDYWGTNSGANGGKGEMIDGIPCRVMDQTYHVHSHLSIALNGQLLTIPAHLGMVPASATFGGCFYQIHNHDGAGRLHVESPTPVNYFLGSFFKIWGQPLSMTNVAGITGLPIVIYVTDNGVTTIYEGDPAAIELTPHREITIQIGSPISAIPNFTWSPN
jgi:hypothetical protein